MTNERIRGTRYYTKRYICLLSRGTSCWLLWWRYVDRCKCFHIKYAGVNLRRPLGHWKHWVGRPVTTWPRLEDIIGGLPACLPACLPALTDWLTDWLNWLTDWLDAGLTDWLWPTTWRSPRQADQTGKGNVDRARQIRRTDGGRTGTGQTGRTDGRKGGTDRPTDDDRRPTGPTDVRRPTGQTDRPSGHGKPKPVSQSWDQTN